MFVEVLGSRARAFLTYCIEAGVGLTAGKLMCGKAVAKSDSTYIHNARLKKLFLQLQKMIRVTDVATYTAGQDRVEQLEKTIETLMQDVLSHKTAWQLGDKKLKALEQQVQRLEGELRRALTGFEKCFTQEAIEDILKGRNRLAERLPKKYVAEE